MHLGDRNSAFFHKSLTMRLSQNHIYFLRDNLGRRLGSPWDLKEHAVAYFKSIFGSTDMPLSYISVDDITEFLPFRCSKLTISELNRHVLEPEITQTLFSLPSDKCPGPDGYPLEFFKASWGKVGPEVVAMVQEFFRNGRLLKDMNTTFISLIPKTREACSLGDFRPISCCNLVYKVISKIIANRLKHVLQECASPNQAVFQKGRSLGENVLLATELIRNYQKTSCPKVSMLKVDIRKAFDTMCWDFVSKLLEAQNFPPLFREWIRQCYTTPKFSILINGEPAGFFNGDRGLRQGDPMSPYLFIMVMEVLSRMLDKVALERKFSMHPDGLSSSMEGISEVLRQFKDMSGLDMNAAKSEILFSGYLEEETVSLSSAMGIKLGSFPTRYLGLPLSL